MKRSAFYTIFFTILISAMFGAPKAQAVVPVFDVVDSTITATNLPLQTALQTVIANVTQPAIVLNTNAIAVAQAGQYQKEIGIPPPSVLPYLSPATLASAATCTGLDCLAWIIVKVVLHNLMQEIVRWVQTGNIDGGPLFVTDWENFLLNAKDKATAVFLQDLELTNLCEPFSLPIRRGLSNNVFGSGPSFNMRASCTMPNMQAFLNGFEGGGGWEAWDQLTQDPNNNPYMVYLMGLEQLTATRQAGIDKNLQEAMSALGLLGQKECEPGTIETEAGDAPLGERCTIVTPGKAVETELSKVLETNLEELNLADEMDEVLGAILNTLLRKILFSVNGLLNFQAAATAQAPQPAPNLNLPVCGNGICSAGETAASCAVDCGTTSGPPPSATCGNNICEVGESNASCPLDCTATPPPTQLPPPPPPTGNSTSPPPPPPPPPPP